MPCMPPPRSKKASSLGVVSLCCAPARTRGRDGLLIGVRQRRVPTQEMVSDLLSNNVRGIHTQRGTIASFAAVKSSL